MLFLEGLKYGLMPLGEHMGKRLPEKFSTFVTLLVALILGVSATQIMLFQC